MSETTLERLARAALLVAGGGSIDDPADGEYAKSVVRAILRELREPTEGMVRAGNCAGFKLSIRTVTTDVWQAMIDHILSEDSDGQT